MSDAQIELLNLFVKGVLSIGVVAVILGIAAVAFVSRGEQNETPLRKYPDIPIDREGGRDCCNRSKTPTYRRPYRRRRQG